MNTVRRLLQIKGHDVWSTTADTSVLDALRLMAEKNVGALLVLEDGKLVGIMSERDYARKVALKGKTSKDMPVAELMTRKTICIGPDQSVAECMNLMVNHHIRHLPVMEHDRLVGVISIGDVVKEIIAEQSATIGYLEDFITGKG